MAAHTGLAWILLCLALVTGVQSKGAVAADGLLGELKAMRAQAYDSVISLDEAGLSRFTAGKKRPYNLIVFLDALQVRDHPQLQMGKLRTEFGYAARAAAAGPAPDAFFFVEIVFEKSPAVFRLVGANMVPHIFRIAGTTRVTLGGEGTLAVANEDKMTFETMMSTNKYPWMAEDMLAYFQPAGLSAAPVDRPNILKHPLFPVAVLVAAGTLGFLAWRLLLAGAFHHPFVWGLGSLLVVWFSMSGGMYNIIRGIPLYIIGKDGRPQFSLPGRSGQLGAEGFFMGSGYVVFSGTISLLTFALPRIPSTQQRTLLAYVFTGLAAYVLLRLFSAYQVKTGYKISTYLV